MENIDNLIKDIQSGKKSIPKYHKKGGKEEENEEENENEYRSMN